MQLNEAFKLIFCVFSFFIWRIYVRITSWYIFILLFKRVDQ